MVLRTPVSQPAGAWGRSLSLSRSWGSASAFGQAMLKSWHSPAGLLFPTQRRKKQQIWGAEEWGRIDEVQELTADAEFCQAKGEVVEIQV